LCGLFPLYIKPTLNLINSVKNFLWPNTIPQKYKSTVNIGSIRMMNINKLIHKLVLWLIPSIELINLWMNKLENPVIEKTVRIIKIWKLLVMFHRIFSFDIKFFIFIVRKVSKYFWFTHNYKMWSSQISLFVLEHVYVKIRLLYPQKVYP